MDVSQEQQALEPPCMFQFPVTFEDVAVYFSREEWECLSLRQRALYRNVMLDNFRSLAAVGFCGRRPDLVSRLEQWDELWVEDCERADLREAQSGPCPGAGKLADHRRCCLQLSWAHEKVHLQGRVPDTLSTGHMQFPSAASGQKADEPVDLQAAVCGESHRQQPGLEEQCKGSTGAQVFICGTCGKVLSCHSRLAAHQMVHSGARSFTCLECGQTFRWVSNLLRHQRNHTSEKPFRCELCGQAFSLKDRLVQHRKVHTGHRPYECGACGKAFKQKSNLLRHQLVHTGERPFHCAVCSKDFRTKENLSHHQRIHSGEKPYTCSECGKAFRWPKGFSIHQRLHLTKRVYKCERCGKGFRHLGFFTRHQRTHGRGEV